MANNSPLKTHPAVDALVSKLRRRQLIGSRETALETVRVLRSVISAGRFGSMEELIQQVKSVGKKLVLAQPKEHTVGNTVRKVLHHIREEYNAATEGETRREQQEQSSFSISRFVLQGQPRKQVASTKASAAPRSEVPREISGPSDDPDSFSRNMKPVFMEAIQDVLDELETVYENIGKSANDHIHSDEIILTVGVSRTVESFLKSATHHRKFTVIVAETAPSYGGHEMANRLAAAGISAFLVPDSSIYALMSRVNKVIIGAHAILANGGVLAISGSLLTALAARAHCTPLVVCAGQFKLTPLWNLYHDFGALDFSDPNAVLSYHSGKLVEKIGVVNAYYDYIKPELVDVFITNDGDHPPASVYRLIKEAYDDEDHEL